MKLEFHSTIERMKSDKHYLIFNKTNFEVLVPLSLYGRFSNSKSEKKIVDGKKYITSGLIPIKSIISARYTKTKVFGTDFGSYFNMEVQDKYNTLLVKRFLANLKVNTLPYVFTAENESKFVKYLKDNKIKLLGYN